MSNNLDLPQVTETQNNKTTTINDQAGAFDAALTENLSVDFSSADITLSDTQFRRNIGFTSASLTTARILTVPAIKRFFFVDNRAGTDTLTVTVGTTSFMMTAGEVASFITDGTANGLSLVANSNAAPFDIASFVGGTPTASVSVLSYISSRIIKFLSGLSNSQAYVGTAPDAETVFTINKNGSSVGSITFASGSQNATFTMTTDTQFDPGDVLEVVAPSDLNSLSDLMITLAGTRN